MSDPDLLSSPSFLKDQGRILPMPSQLKVLLTDEQRAALDEYVERRRKVDPGYDFAPEHRAFVMDGIGRPDLAVKRMPIGRPSREQNALHIAGAPIIAREGDVTATETIGWITVVQKLLGLYTSVNSRLGAKRKRTLVEKRPWSILTQESDGKVLKVVGPTGICQQNHHYWIVSDAEPAFWIHSEAKVNEAEGSWSGAAHYGTSRDCDFTLRLIEVVAEIHASLELYMANQQRGNSYSPIPLPMECPAVKQVLVQKYFIDKNGAVSKA